MQMWIQKLTVIFAATTGRTPWYPASFICSDGPGGRCASFLIIVWIHAAELHDIKEFAEVRDADPNRDDAAHQSSYSCGSFIHGFKF